LSNLFTPILIFPVEGEEKFTTHRNYTPKIQDPRRQLKL
jgi:hypothetical protein